ncbi:MAG: carboxylating nicotinate-nucleotide diphosphorylase [Armatimonadetes bacterium]|nr:carboxylating nicotinate-nucleotide diphosphorylase [Armatimonadota bacterium]
MIIGLDPIHVERIVKNALAEDIGSGDITTALTVPAIARVDATIVSRSEGILAGVDVARAAFAIVDSRIMFEAVLEDGSHLEPGSLIANVQGGAAGILTGERVALNFLQRMCGIATLTAKYVERVSHTKAKIVDTRKTTPGLRVLEKYAVAVGGGQNHRFGLYDGILIKDNHVASVGSVRAAINAARENAPHTLRIEVEVDSLDQLAEAIECEADAVLLDNFSPETLRKAVEMAAGRVILEASGGVNLENVAEIAETGVDLISVGALTHSAPALDISLEFGGNHISS